MINHQFLLNSPLSIILPIFNFTPTCRALSCIECNGRLLKILTIIGKWIIHVKATPITGVEDYRYYWYCNIFSLQANWQSWRAMCALFWRYGDVREQILWIFIISSLWATFRICSRSTADEMRAFIQISICDELGIKRMPLPSITTSASLPMSKIICLSTPHSLNYSNWSFAKKKWNYERVSKWMKFLNVDVNILSTEV